MPCEFERHNPYPKAQIMQQNLQVYPVCASSSPLKQGKRRLPEHLLGTHQDCPVSSPLCTLQPGKPALRPELKGTREAAGALVAMGNFP